MRFEIRDEARTEERVERLVRHNREEVLNELEVRLVVAEVDLHRWTPSERVQGHGGRAARTCPWTRVPTCSCAAFVTPGWQ